MQKETLPLAPQPMVTGFSQMVDELSLSSISADIVALNFRVLQGDSAYEHLLYGIDQKECRRNDGRLNSTWLRKYNHLDYGGWWCSGVDLVSGKDSEWGSFKPFRPRVITGKIIKYEHPPQVPTGIFALKISEQIFEDLILPNYPSYPREAKEGFWDWVKRNPVPLVITEGAKKAAALLSVGRPAIALPGIWNAFDKEGEVLESLRVLSQPSREFIFCFDQDKKWTTRNDISRAIKKIGKALLNLDTHNSVSIMVWEPEEGKGIDDVLFKNQQGKVEEILESRLIFEEYLEKYCLVKELTKPKLLEFILKYLGKDLAFNTLTQRVEYKGKNLELLPELTYWMIEEFGVFGSDAATIASISYVAKKNAYNPVQRYLEGCLKAKVVPIDNLSSRYLGTKDPLYDIFVKKWLIGAVARAFSPGCTLQTALILQGKTGIGKSRFFKTLGGEFFDDSLGSNVESTKSLLVLHKSWIQEWAEFERVAEKGGTGDLKAFISRDCDCFVAPYGRDAIEHPRATVLCGTVNHVEFLRDETGDRRFWIIPVNERLGKINLELLAKERDGIWKSAVLEFQKGEVKGLSPWILTEEEESLSADNNDPFRVGDEWEVLIENYLQQKPETSISDILRYIFNIEPAQQDRQVQKRVASILLKLGWTKTGRTRDALEKRHYTWIPQNRPVPFCPIRRKEWDREWDS